MRFFRLEDKSRGNAAAAFSGLGGLYAAGRWNSLGNRVVYTSQSLALASLEKLVHAHSVQALAGLVYFELQIPDTLVEKSQQLPPNWEAEPVSPAPQAFGDQWLEQNRSPALLVPSAIIQIEHNCILNPQHPEFSLAWVAEPQPFRCDARIRSLHEAALVAKRRSR